MSAVALVRMILLQRISCETALNQLILFNVFIILFTFKINKYLKNKSTCRDVLSKTAAAATYDTQLTDNRSLTDCKLSPWSAEPRWALPASHSFPLVSFQPLPSLHRISHSHSLPSSRSLAFLVALSLRRSFSRGFKTFSISTHGFSIKLAYQFSCGFVF